MIVTMHVNGLIIKLQMDDADFLCKVFIGCASGRNSMDVVIANQCEWVRSVLKHREGESLSAESRC